MSNWCDYYRGVDFRTCFKAPNGVLYKRILLHLKYTWALFGIGITTAVENKLEIKMKVMGVLYNFLIIILVKIY